MAEVDILIDSQFGPAGSAPADDIPEFNETPVTVPGDLWFLDENSVLCADARDPDPHKYLLKGCQAEMVFTDPP